MATTDLAPTLVAMAVGRRDVARKAQLLVDVSVFARSAAISIEVDVTAAAWDACGAPEGSLRWPGSDDLALDLLGAVRAAAARSGSTGMDEHSVDFTYLSGAAPAVVSLTFRVGPGDDGEPIGTISLRQECWPPVPYAMPGSI